MMVVEMVSLRARPLLLALAGLGSLLAFGLLVVHSQGDLQVGYAILTPASGNPTPVASALFSSTNAGGVLIWEAGVAAVEPISRGRVFVDQSRDTRTAVALVNPSSSSVTATLTLRDTSGSVVESREETFAAGRHRALFADELFAGLTDFRGTLTFDAGSDQLAAVALRQSANARGEAIFATLPVADLDAAPASGDLVFPHMGAGSGLSTRIILVNRSSESAAGRIRFFDDWGEPLTVELEGRLGTEFDFQMAAGGAYLGEVDLTSGLAVGSAVVSVTAGESPSGVAIFRFASGSAVTSEAGVEASTPTTRARIFVDQEGTRTGVAVANPQSSPAALTIRLLDGDGTELERATRLLAARGHLALFADELFALAGDGFTGLLELASDVAVSPLTLKLTVNERSDPVLTTLPVAHLTSPQTATRLVVPQLGFGDFGTGKFATRLILINPSDAAAAAGMLDFFQSSGQALTVPLGGETASRFDYHVAARGGRALRPGVVVGAPGRILLDAAGSSEVAVNEGGTVPLDPVVFDEEGNLLDGIPLSYSSLSPEVATVNASGTVTGVEAGFSTLTISSGAVVATATITVARVTSAVSGIEITGVAQDLGRRVYLAHTGGHTILRAEEPGSEPRVYAGVENAAGLIDDRRLSARFNEPAFLALDQASGVLYVSDSANHVIRLVEPGPEGTVRTFAGSGLPGSGDGSPEQASFHTPQGVTLDHRGGLWVSDSGNHTIRRIDLTAREVSTIAGRAGEAGLADGQGGEARFDSPGGLAVERESLAEQLARESRGEAPPPVVVIVADTGNGVLRRVDEEGNVETLTGVEAAATESFQREPLFLGSPLDVEPDCAGNIYVSDPRAEQVRLLLGGLGKLVQIAERRTFGRVRGLDAVDCGGVTVGDSGGTHRIDFAGPSVSRIVPDTVGNAGGDQVTVLGRNFSPDSLVLVSGRVIEDARVRDTGTIVFTAPALDSGATTLTVQNRGGLAQGELLVEPVPLGALSPGDITTAAGGGNFIGDGLPGVEARLSEPKGIAVGPDGSLFVADYEHHRIRRVDPKLGIITTVAGTGERGFPSDGELGTASTLSFPERLAVTETGDLYLTQGGLWKVDSGNGRLLKVEMDRGLPGFHELAAGPEESLYVSDQFGNQIQRWEPASGEVTVVAGTGEQGFSGDGGPASQAGLNHPQGMALDGAGNLFVADSGNDRIRRIDGATGIITTVAGGGGGSDGGSAVEASLTRPEAVAVDSDGNLYIGGFLGFSIRRVSAATGIIDSIAQLDDSRYLAANGAGELFASDPDANGVYRVDPEQQELVLVAGSGLVRDPEDGKRAVFTTLLAPTGIALDSQDGIYIADRDDQRIRKVAAEGGLITTLAGTGEVRHIRPGDGTPALEAGLFFPDQVAVAADGTVYFADSGIWKIENTLLREVVFISNIAGLEVDAAGNLVFSTQSNDVLRYDFSAAQVSVVAGTGIAAYAGDGGPAVEASLNVPRGLAFDAAGNLYIADQFNDRVRKVDAQSGIITTVAGGGSQFLGENIPATDTRLASPQDVAVDRAGNLYISSTFWIHKVDAASGLIHRVADLGGGPPGSGVGDNQPALGASFFCEQIAVDSAGNLYLTDSKNARVRIIKTPP